MPGYRGADGSFVATKAEAGLVEVGSPVIPVVARAAPADGAAGVAPTAAITARLSADVSGIGARSFTLRDDTSGKPVPATVSYEPATRTAVLRPTRALVHGHHYSATIGGAWSSTYNTLPSTTWSFTVRR